MGIMLKITEEMRAAARKLLRTPVPALRHEMSDDRVKLNISDRVLLTAISDGKRKLIQAHWWTKHFKKIDEIKLGKLQRLAGAGNPNEHERALAARKVGEFKGARSPGMPPEPPPFPKELWRKPLKKELRRKRGSAPPTQRSLPTPDGGVNKEATTSCSDGSGGVNESPRRGGVNTKPKRTGDRHLNKGDRHAPGYMRDYMRRRRAKSATPQ
jgi:hypothetical protein